MQRTIGTISFILLLEVVTPIYSSLAATVSVSVASNFANTLQKLSKHFELTSEHRVVISQGSSGKLAAQILNGAPIDLFFSADTRLAKKVALAQNKNEKTHIYALGRLAIASASKLDSADIKESFIRSKFIAIGNPRLAPYGAAGAEFLKRQKIIEQVKHKLVYGENIGQALRFVLSGSADIGIISLSQALLLPRHLTPNWQKIPEDLHPKIEQHYVALNSKISTISFLKFMKSQPALSLIKNSGYSIP